MKKIIVIILIGIILMPVKGYSNPKGFYHGKHYKRYYHGRNKSTKNSFVSKKYDIRDINARLSNHAIIKKYHLQVATK